MIGSPGEVVSVLVADTQSENQAAASRFSESPARLEAQEPQKSSLGDGRFQGGTFPPCFTFHKQLIVHIGRIATLIRNFPKEKEKKKKTKRELHAHHAERGKARDDGLMM